MAQDQDQTPIGNMTQSGATNFQQQPETQGSTPASTSISDNMTAMNQPQPAPAATAPQNPQVSSEPAPSENMVSPSLAQATAEISAQVEAQQPSQAVASVSSQASQNMASSASSEPDTTTNPITDQTSPTPQTPVAKGMGKYQVKVIGEKCIGAASCVAVAPKAFRLNENQIAEVIDSIGQESDENLLLSAQSCPTMAIEIVDSETGEKVWPK